MIRRPILGAPLPRASTSRLLWWALATALLLTACAAKEGDDIGSAIFNGTTPEGLTVEPPRTTLPQPQISAIRVPVNQPTIQAAVDIAQPGDLILIEPGTYLEEVVVSVPDIVIRGRDRNTVFIDGNHAFTTGVQVLADGVAIENLTVRNYLGDAVTVGTGDVVPVNRFRALHVTTSNTGDNGIALRNVTNAEVQQGWQSGHAGAGVLVDSCVECNTFITRTLAEFSNVGMRIVGANRNVWMISATSRNNRVGVLVEDGPSQPSTGVVLGANVILNNGFGSTPTNDPTLDRGFGVGIQLGGTVSTEITANRVLDNLRTGVLLAPNNVGSSGDPIAPNVSANLIEGHPESDIVLAFGDAIVDPSTCVTNNGVATIGPPGAAEAAACGDANVAPPTFSWTGDPRESIPYANGPVPPGIDGMENADSIPPTPAGLVQPPDTSALVVPES